MRKVVKTTHSDGDWRCSISPNLSIFLLLAFFASNEYVKNCKDHQIWNHRLRKWFQEKVVKLKNSSTGSLKQRIHELDLPPTQDSSHHQDDYIFRLGNPYKPLFATVSGLGSRSDTWALVILSFKPLPNMLPLTNEKGLLHTQCHHMHMLSVSAYCQLPSNSLRVWIALQAGSQIFTNREKEWKRFVKWVFPKIWVPPNHPFN